MDRNDAGDAFRRAAVKTRERIRQDRRRIPARFAPLFEYIEEHLFDRDFGPEIAWRRSGVDRRVPPPLGMTLAAYIKSLRIETAERMLALTAKSVPAGHVAGAVGITSYHTWLRAYRRITGRKPEPVRITERLRPRFDDVTWHHASYGTLPLADVRSLLRRLRRLEDEACPSTEIPRSRVTGESGGRCGGISEADARKALRRAGAGPRRRLRRDAEGLPRDLARVLRDVADHLFDPGLTLAACLERTEVRDTGITTKIGFFLGETWSGVVERRRMETAATLLADRRFTVKRIAEEVGCGFQRFTAGFRRRAGASAGEIRKTLSKTADSTIYEIWRRAGEGSLEAAGIRALDTFLRGLYPDELRPGIQRTLTVRTDVDPQHVERILAVHRSVAGESARGAFEEIARASTEYSAAYWYCHWIRDRLGRDSLTAAWAEWEVANRDLLELLGLPCEHRAERVRKEPRFQTDAFLWLLVDSLLARLFHDAAESEHFADLGIAATKARWQRDRDADSAGFRGLMLAFQGNALRRRNELLLATSSFNEAFAAIRPFEVEPWITGRIQVMYAAALERQGHSRQARRRLFLGGALLKKAGDELERLRSLIRRTSTWFAVAKDATRLLTASIRILEERYPFERDLLQCAHVNRILSRVYLVDRLTGRHLAQVKQLRRASPAPTSALTAVSLQQLDGILEALAGDLEGAVVKLLAAASWFQDHQLDSYAAVCWLQYAWAVLDLDSGAAERAAQTAYTCLQNSGFENHALRQIAWKIRDDATHQRLDRERLRLAILLSVCPRMNSHLATSRMDP